MSLFNKNRLLNRKYVDEVKKPWWKNASVEFSGKTLIYALRIFLDKKISEKEKKLLDTPYRIFPDYRFDVNDAYSYEEKDNKYQKIKGVLFEYDGDKHYYSSFKCEADRIKTAEVVRLGFRKIRIPFYLQFTKDIAKFIFDGLMYHYTGKKYYSDEKYYNTIQSIYYDPVTGESLKNVKLEKIEYQLENNDPYPLIPASGMHWSEYVPSCFHEKGLERFIKDITWKSTRPGNDQLVSAFPESSINEIFHTLDLYAKDAEINNTNRDDLIFPMSDSYMSSTFMKLYSSYKPLKQEYLNRVFFLRKKYKI